MKLSEQQSIKSYDESVNSLLNLDLSIIDNNNNNEIEFIDNIVLEDTINKIDTENEIHDISVEWPVFDVESNDEILTLTNISQEKKNQELVKKSIKKSQNEKMLYKIEERNKVRSAIINKNFKEAIRLIRTHFKKVEKYKIMILALKIQHFFVILEQNELNALKFLRVNLKKNHDDKVLLIDLDFSKPKEFQIKVLSIYKKK